MIGKLSQADVNFFGLGWRVRFGPLPMPRLRVQIASQWSSVFPNREMGVPWGSQRTSEQIAAAMGATTLQVAQAISAGTGAPIPDYITGGCSPAGGPMNDAAGGPTTLGGPSPILLLGLAATAAFMLKRR